MQVLLIKKTPKSWSQSSGHNSLVCYIYTLFVQQLESFAMGTDVVLNGAKEDWITLAQRHFRHRPQRKLKTKVALLKLL